MTIPAFLFGTLVAALLGTLYHLWKGGNLFYIILYMIASVIGFWVGHYCAEYLRISFWRFGPVIYGPSLVSALFFLLVTSWLFNKAKLQQDEQQKE